MRPDITKRVESTRTSRTKDTTISFHLCHVNPPEPGDATARTDAAGQKRFHFHEYKGTSPNRHKKCSHSGCKEEESLSFKPIELAVQGAMAKVLRDDSRLSKLRPVL